MASLLPWTAAVVVFTWGTFKNSGEEALDWLTGLIVAIGGYLVGSISGARLVSRIVAPGKPVPAETVMRIEGTDRTVTMKSVSATSVSANLGPRYGFMTYLFDLMKVFVPVLLLRIFMPGTHYYLIPATTGVAGHIWPVYHRFRGGRGASPIYGGVFAIDWPGVLVAAFGGMIFGFVVLKDIYFTYMAGLWFLIPWLWLRTRDPYVVLYAVAINVMFAISSIPEAREWFKVKREDPVWRDPAKAWQISAMGRGMVKMMKRLGLLKEEAPAANPDPEA
jgi:glycerol-3-phosphate acyltransferase PlsY